MNKKYTINLNSQEKQSIDDIKNNAKTSKTIRNRACILLMADESVGKPAKQEEIAKRCGVSDVTVYQTIKDYSTCGLEYALKYKRSNLTPNPEKITGEIEARVIALACSEAPTGFSKWTVRLLAKRIVELEILEHVCPETVRKALKKHNLSPI